MSSPIQLRQGYINEYLALYVLSKFCFCSNPVTILDDLGTDFFCCMYETREERLLPVRSFAIQVKSNCDPLNFDGKIEYIKTLELPFFVGVVSRTELSLRLYSGEWIPFLFAHKGDPKGLRLHLEETVDVNNPYEEIGSGAYRLKFPFVTTIKARDEGEQLSASVDTLQKLCARMHSNLASWKSNEHLFSLPVEGQYKIFAGEGSAEVFKLNLYKRLHEAILNFIWLIEDERPVNTDEAKLLIGLFQQLEDRGIRIPIDYKDDWKKLNALLLRG